MTNNLCNEEELLQLQKRARRRLVGAVVLVLLAVVVLWNLLDATPPLKLTGDKVVVSCTASGERRASGIAISPHTTSTPITASALTDSSDKETFIHAEKEVLSRLTFEETALPSTKVLPAEQKQGENKEGMDKKLKPVDIPPSLSKKDPKRILEGLDEGPVIALKSSDKGGVKYRIQVAAYSDANKAQNIVNKLKAAGIRVNSEKITTNKGELTRVRVGPYASRADAEAALKKMRAQGVNGMLVTK
jgi:DedD protein